MSSSEDRTSRKDEQRQVDATKAIDEAEVTNKALGCPTASKQILVFLFKYYIKTQYLFQCYL
jgi:hypothetical protein